MKELVKIVIPTYKRAGKVTTHKVVANCSLVVREEEYEAYRKAYPDMEIFKIPKGEIQNGIADTREWIMQKEYPEYSVYLSGRGGQSYTTTEFSDAGLDVIYSNHEAKYSDSVLTVLMEEDDPLSVILREKIV